MPTRFGPHAANALTALRILLTPAFVAAIYRGAGRGLVGALAVAIFAVVAASDVFDGRLARRWGSASHAGRAFDHFADIGFIVPALSAYALLGITPWWVPAVIAGAFGFYVFDSWSHANNGAVGLVSSRIGHAGGVLNYAVIGVLVCNNTAGIHLLSPALLSKLFWLVPVYSCAAVVARLAGRRAVVPEARLITSSE